MIRQRHAIITGTLSGAWGVAGWVGCASRCCRCCPPTPPRLARRPAWWTVPTAGRCSCSGRPRSRSRPTTRWVAGSPPCSKGPFDRLPDTAFTAHTYTDPDGQVHGCRLAETTVELPLSNQTGGSVALREIHRQVRADAGAAAAERVMRRADAVAMIGTALLAKVLNVPSSTVRGWLRRIVSVAERVLAVLAAGQRGRALPRSRWCGRVVEIAGLLGEVAGGLVGTLAPGAIQVSTVT